MSETYQYVMANKLDEYFTKKKKRLDEYVGMAVAKHLKVKVV